MKLLHLTAIGSEKENATIEFASKLTVIFGASETGKSYIIDALNFMLGGKSLRKIPEASGYETLLLGIQFDDGSIATLSRKLTGGSISVFEDDYRTAPGRSADRTLRAQHSKNDEANLSAFLLGEIGISGAQIRKNSSNKLQSMSFRNLAHLCVIDEERIQSRTSPVESGNFASKTSERSAFKLILEGIDDSHLVEVRGASEFKRVNRGQIDVLDRAIQQVKAQLGEAIAQDQLRNQIERLSARIASVSSSVSESLARRDSLMNQRDVLRDTITKNRRTVEEGNLLVSRFSLLDQQYSSDLDRFKMVKEAGSLLGYFDSEVCVFCGAGAEHQNPDHAIYETVELAESVDSEIARTEVLRRDLAQTINEIRRQQVNLDNELRRITSEVDEKDSIIDELDRYLEPINDELMQLLDSRVAIEHQLSLFDQVAHLEKLKSSVARETPETVEESPTGITSSTQHEFSAYLKRVLAEWQLPGGEDAYIDLQGDPEIFIQGRRRADRGKGMRAVLHAGFSIALSEYCLAKELPHPGFVALDTPVLTYRDAELSHEDSTESDELVSQTVADAFYRYLALEHPGQVIVLENANPPRIDAYGCSVEFFSGASLRGRSGFYPQ